ncbi:DUF1987 domain-containing protein [Algivirga pacifica]|uniref:DUF1987 domain-containing protein n=1 Tax=Algivirga pacifica TaxID=1162670 RepID=A0ABP9CYE8_9BACT
MKNLIIQENKQPYIPYINFDASTGKCIISGESYPENAFDFYASLTSWIKEYFDSGKETLQLTIDLSYFNTSTASAMIIFFETLKVFQDKGKQLLVEWEYEDIDGKEEGESFAMDTEIKMTVKEKKS